MTGISPITIRICPGSSAATDWSGVMPEQVTFASCLVKCKDFAILLYYYLMCHMHDITRKRICALLEKENIVTLLALKCPMCGR